MIGLQGISRDCSKWYFVNNQPADIRSNLTQHFRVDIGDGFICTPWFTVKLSRKRHSMRSSHYVQVNRNWRSIVQTEWVLADSQLNLISTIKLPYVYYGKCHGLAHFGRPIIDPLVNCPNTVQLGFIAQLFEHTLMQIGGLLPCVGSNKSQSSIISA